MKRSILSAVLFAAAALPLISQSLDFQIRYYDKKIYYTDDPVYIKLELINNSPEAISLKIPEDRLFNTDFRVRSLTNRVLDHSADYRLRKGSHEQLFYRELVLTPGERYGYIENLSDYIALDRPGIYQIQGLFFPELASSSAVPPLESNPLTLNLRPAEGIDAMGALLDEATGQILRAHPLPPDETVAYMLRARQKGHWHRFMLYLDTEALFLRNPGNEARFKRISEEEQHRLLREYEEALKQESVDSDISVIPLEFEIQKTEYTAREAQVWVIEKFAYPDFLEVKQYIYHLHKSGNIWYIDDYQVRNLGTE